MKIVVAEKISSSAVDFLREPGWEIITADQINGNLPEHLATADALVVRSAVQVDGALLEHAPKLRVVGRAGVGVDNVDLDAATRKGIAVMNTPGGNAVAVAEQTLGMMLAMARFLCKADASMHAGKWEKKSLQGTELRAKTLGIVGLGKIGMEVAKRAQAFGMQIVGHDPFVSAAIAKEQKITMATLGELYAAADYITLHVGLTPQTTGMINVDSIKKMKKGVRLVNCARGELVDEAALAEALKQGQVAGAGLDVAALDLVPAAACLDREGVGDLALVRDLEGVGAGLGDGDRAGCTGPVPIWRAARGRNGRCGSREWCSRPDRSWPRRRSRRRRRRTARACRSAASR